MDSGDLKTVKKGEGLVKSFGNPMDKENGKNAQSRLRKKKDTKILSGGISQVRGIAEKRKHGEAKGFGLDNEKKVASRKGLGTLAGKRVFHRSYGHKEEKKTTLSRGTQKIDEGTRAPTKHDQRADT